MSIRDAERRTNAVPLAYQIEEDERRLSEAEFVNDISALII